MSEKLDLDALERFARGLASRETAPSDIPSDELFYLNAVGAHLIKVIAVACQRDALLEAAKRILALGHGIQGVENDARSPDDRAAYYQRIVEHHHEIALAAIRACEGK